VDELVDDDVLDDSGRQKDRAPVEAEPSALPAGDPAVAEILHRHARGLDADAMLEALDA